jgi:hypothetical protein
MPACRAAALSSGGDSAETLQAAAFNTVDANRKANTLQSHDNDVHRFSLPKPREALVVWMRWVVRGKRLTLTSVWPVEMPRPGALYTTTTRDNLPGFPAIFSLSCAFSTTSWSD